MARPLWAGRIVAEPPASWSQCREALRVRADEADELNDGKATRDSELHRSAVCGRKCVRESIITIIL
jgi:hypothetical protein